MVVGCLLSAVQLSRWEKMLVRIAYDAVEGINAETLHQRPQQFHRSCSRLSSLNQSCGLGISVIGLQSEHRIVRATIELEIQSK
jgi:hypothetical protein